MKKIMILFLAFCLQALFGDDSLIYDVTFQGRATESQISDFTEMIIDYNAPGFRLFSNMTMFNDDKYSPSHDSYMLGHYLILNENYLYFYTDTMEFIGGRLYPRSMLDTPYSLFLTSQPITSPGASFTYNGERFFYYNRWSQLNSNSKQEYPDGRDSWRDKGFNHKTFGVNYGNWRFGYQDSSVYLDRSFDSEYFLSPMPQLFVQLVTSFAGKPWEEERNDNIVMGFFGEYDDNEALYAMAQVLIDDINLSIIPWVETDNVTKMAWSLGGHWNSPWGKLGFYHAGATKYTFAATYVNTYYSDLPYEYTYYPATEYELRDGGFMPLLPEDNYLGYLHGENNIAFMLTYGNTFFPGTPGEFILDSSLEWVLNGSKSPANPWHEKEHWSAVKEIYELLSDDTIEQVLQLSCDLRKPMGNWEFMTHLTLGGAFNALALEEVAPDEPKIFRPQAGDHHFFMNFHLGFTYHWQIF